MSRAAGSVSRCGAAIRTRSTAVYDADRVDDKHRDARSAVHDAVSDGDALGGVDGVNDAAAAQLLCVLVEVRVCRRRPASLMR